MLLHSARWKPLFNYNICIKKQVKIPPFLDAVSTSVETIIKKLEERYPESRVSQNTDFGLMEVLLETESEWIFCFIIEDMSWAYACYTRVLKSEDGYTACVTWDEDGYHSVFETMSLKDFFKLESRCRSEAISFFSDSKSAETKKRLFPLTKKNKFYNYDQEKFEKFESKLLDPGYPLIEEEDIEGRGNQYRVTRICDQYDRKKHESLRVITFQDGVTYVYQERFKQITFLEKETVKFNFEKNQDMSLQHKKAVETVKEAIKRNYEEKCLNAKPKK